MTPRISSNKKKLSLEDTLREAQHFAEANQLEESLAVVKGVKALDPGNIYVLAFEKQVEQLLGLGSTGALTQEQRADILESLPGIVDRAIEGATASPAEGVMPPPQGGSPGVRDDKAAALEWLKDQYFQHAHEYVQKGQHDHALAEIRRVYIIEPNNATALDFERRVMQLAGIASPAPGPPPSQRGLRLVTKETLANEPAPPEETEPVLMKTEEWSSPVLEEQTLEQQPPSPAVAQAPARPQLQPQAPARPATRRSLRPITTAVLMIAVLAVGATIYMLWMHGQTTKRSEQRRSVVNATPPQEVFIGAPTAGEQSYVVSSPSENSGTGAPEVSEENPLPVTSEKPSSAAPERRPARESAKQPSPGKASERPGSSPVKVAPAKTEPSPTGTLQPLAATASTQPVQQEQSAPPAPVVQKEAQIIKLERPRFSEAAYETGVAGQVIVQVQIDASGKPLQTRILKSDNAILDNPVVDAIMRSQFAPAQMSSGPVSSWLTIPFKFARK